MCTPVVPYRPGSRCRALNFYFMIMICGVGRRQPPIPISHPLHVLGVSLWSVDDFGVKAPGSVPLAPTEKDWSYLPKPNFWIRP